MERLFLGIGFILAGICSAVLGLLLTTLSSYFIPFNLLAVFCIVFSLLLVISGLVIISNECLKENNNKKDNNKTSNNDSI